LREKKFVGIGYEEEEKLDWARCERTGGGLLKQVLEGRMEGEETKRKTKVWNDR